MAVAATDDSSDESPPPPPHRPWRPVGRLCAIPVVIGGCQLGARLCGDGWPAVVLAFAPVLLLGLASCVALGTALIALCLGQGRYAAIEAGLGVVTGYAAMFAVLCCVPAMGPESGPQ